MIYDAFAEILDATQVELITKAVMEEIISRFGGQQIYITCNNDRIKERDTKIRGSYHREIQQILEKYQISESELRHIVHGRGAKK